MLFSSKSRVRRHPQLPRQPNSHPVGHRQWEEVQSRHEREVSGLSSSWCFWALNPPGNEFDFQLGGDGSVINSSISPPVADIKNIKIFMVKRPIVWPSSALRSGVSSEPEGPWWSERGPTFPYVTETLSEFHTHPDEC